MFELIPKELVGFLCDGAMTVITQGKGYSVNRQGRMLLENSKYLFTAEA